MEAIVRRGAVSAPCRSELGAGDVLVATPKQDCGDSCNPSEQGHDRDRQTAPLRLGTIWAVPSPGGDTDLPWQRDARMTDCDRWAR